VRLAAGRELNRDWSTTLSPIKDEGDGHPIPLCPGMSGPSGMVKVGSPGHARIRDTSPSTALCMKT